MPKKTDKNLRVSQPYFIYHCFGFMSIALYRGDRNFPIWNRRK